MCCIQSVHLCSLCDPLRLFICVIECVCVCVFGFLFGILYFMQLIQSVRLRYSWRKGTISSYTILFSFKIIIEERKKFLCFAISTASAGSCIYILAFIHLQNNIYLFSSHFFFHFDLLFAVVVVFFFSYEFY